MDKRHFLSPMIWKASRLMGGLSAGLPVAKTHGRDGYALLPFRFIPLDGTRYLATNFSGEHLVLTREDTHRFIRHQLPQDSAAYRSLKSRHFLLDQGSTVAVDLLAAKYRTKLVRLKHFTSLFMFVTTLRCDHSCSYCQVSHRSETVIGCDMSVEVAERAIDFMFRSPSPAIKVEFQGGESLLNFERVRQIVLAVEERNSQEGRDIEYVITSNLSALTDQILDFCFEHGVYFSTSLDGPRDLHNANRPRPGHDSYEEVTEGIRRVREALGPFKVSALMTTTRASLTRARDIVDEYVQQGLSAIFLRTINPYGLAAAGQGYSVDEWLTFYREALGYIIELAAGGVCLREEYASLILRKMLTPYSTGYVDLQSPAGIGIAGIIFHYDGSVYCSDEARMLAEMGDQRFRMGSLLEDSYDDVMLNEPFLETLNESIAESCPQCADCAVLPYCGSDPVRHYRAQGDVVGFKPTSDFCRKHMGIVKHLVTLVEDSPTASRVLRSWI